MSRHTTSPSPNEPRPSIPRLPPVPQKPIATIPKHDKIAYCTTSKGETVTAYRVKGSCNRGSYETWRFIMEGGIPTIRGAISHLSVIQMVQVILIQV